MFTSRSISSLHMSPRTLRTRFLSFWSLICASICVISRSAPSTSLVTERTSRRGIEHSAIMRASVSTVTSFFNSLPIAGSSFIFASSRGLSSVSR